jgi:hypothetical protein
MLRVVKRPIRVQLSGHHRLPSCCACDHADAITCSSKSNQLDAVHVRYGRTVHFRPRKLQRAFAYSVVESCRSGSHPSQRQKLYNDITAGFEKKQYNSRVFSLHQVPSGNPSECPRAYITRCCFPATISRTVPRRTSTARYPQPVDRLPVEACSIATVPSQQTRSLFPYRYED